MVVYLILIWMRWSNIFRRNLLALGLIIPSYVQSQPITLVICDTLNHPLASVHVVNVSAGTGTVSNQFGAVHLEIRDSDQYTFSFIGFVTRNFLGSELIGFDTIRLVNQINTLNELVVAESPLTADQLIRAAKRKHKKSPSTEDRTFEGYYEETLIQDSDTHHLRCVLLMTGYDHKLKTSVNNFMDYPESFALLGIDLSSPPKQFPIFNGLRWLTRTGQIRNKIGGRKVWDSEQIDSIKQDGDRLLYWVSTHSDKWGPQHSLVIDNAFNILYLEDLGRFKSKIYYNPDVSLSIPLYCEAQMPPFTKDSLVSLQSFKLTFIKEEQAFEFKRAECMPGDKMYDEESKSMWEQQALQPNFPWEAYDPSAFAN